MSEIKNHGIMAEFDGPEQLMEAAKGVRDAGYKNWDVHSPYAIHGMTEAMGEKPSVLPWIVAAMALVGGVVGLTMQWWMNGIDYKYVIAGKPFFSYQAFFPVTFALAVLFSTIAVVVTLVIFIGPCGPKFHHPVFFSDRFAKVTDDGFFISIMSDDPLFIKQKTTELLESIGASNVELLIEEIPG